MFRSYRTKKDGAIRGFDMTSPVVRVSVVLIVLACILIAVFCLFPIVWVFMASFKDIKEFNINVTIFPSSFDLSKLAKTWKQLNFLRHYKNSLISVAGCVICAIFFNGLLAYALAILKPKGHRIVLTLVLWSMMIPATTNIIAVFKNINTLGLSKTFVPIWLAFGANAFYLVLFKEFFEGIPSELLEAARLDGCGVMGVFIRIVLPLSKPIIAVVAIYALTASWSDFLLPYLVLGKEQQTVMVRLFAFKDTPTDAVSVLRACLFAIIPPTVLFAFFQRFITDSAAAGAVKG